MSFHTFNGKGPRRNAEARRNLLKILGAAAGGVMIGALVFLIALLIIKALA